MFIEPVIVVERALNHLRLGALTPLVAVFLGASPLRFWLLDDRSRVAQQFFVESILFTRSASRDEDEERHEHESAQETEIENHGKLLSPWKVKSEQNYPVGMGISIS